MKPIFKYNQIIEKIADSFFLNLEEYQHEIFNSFLIHRNEDYEKFTSDLSEINKFGGNMLVVGEPGVGKTIFLKWVINTSSLFTNSKGKTNYTFIDLQEYPLIKKIQVNILTILCQF